MSSAIEKAILYFERSSLQNQDHKVLHDLEFLTIGNIHEAVRRDASSIQEEPFNKIQRLDNHLRYSMAKQDPYNALKRAESMQKYAPKSYYGYYRAAQIHLVHEEYRKAFKAYINGYKAVIHGIDLLRESAEDTQHIFDQVAGELAKNRQFLKASGIASWMISMVPTSPMGYMRAAELYERQGMIKAAMEVYQKGISSIPVKNRDLLVEHMSILQKRIDQTPYCDFMIEVPLEIASSIARNLTVRDLINCMSVSTAWKDRIEQCAEAWHELSVELDRKKFNITAIQHVKQFVQRLSVATTEYNSSIKDLLVSIGNGEFKNLTYLNLKRCIPDTKHISYLPKIFESVNLTSLHLTIHHPSYAGCHLPLDQVLGPCPHLKQLTYHSDSFPTEYNRCAGVSTKPTMITHLSIGGYRYYDEIIENPHFFIPLIPLFPLLVDLCITYSSPGDLQTISEQCPKLRRLFVTQYPNHVFLDFTDSEGEQKGLKYLHIDGYIDPKDISFVVVKNSKTLISVDISLDYENDNDGQLVDPNWDWKHIPKLNSPTLKKLSSFTMYYWPFETWIGDCPALEEIRLEGIAGLTDSIFTALKGLPELRVLDFEDGQNLTDSGFATFFNDLQKQGSKLHTVIIRICESIRSETLISLLALQSLRDLRISSCTGITEIVFQDFVTNIKSCSKIDNLSFCNIDGITDESLLQLLHTLPRLQQLNLHSLNYITDKLLSDINDVLTITNLSTLTISSCKQITRRGIGNAKKLLHVIEKDMYKPVDM